jgi:hypothetical protein
MLAPLFLLALYPASIQGKLLGICSLMIALSIWCIPMLTVSGGSRVYFAALGSLRQIFPGRNTAFKSSPPNSMARAVTILAIYMLTFGAASILPILAVRSARTDMRIRLCTLVWIAPSLCFFTFIILKFVNSVYHLLAAVPGYIWLGKWLAVWYQIMVEGCSSKGRPSRQVQEPILQCSCARHCIARIVRFDGLNLKCKKLIARCRKSTRLLPWPALSKNDARRAGGTVCI